MSNNIVKSLEELHNLAEKGLLSKEKLTNHKSSQSILKCYDNGLDSYNKGDDEACYLYLYRFVHNSMELRKSSYYLKERDFIDTLITKKKLTNAMAILEKLKENLRERYEPKLNIIIDKPIIVEDFKKEQLEFTNEYYKIVDRSNRFITPRELVSLIKFNKTLKFLIIDIRQEPNELLDLTLCNHQFLNIINIPLKLIQKIKNDGLVLWKLERELEEAAKQTIKNRQQFNLIILFDKNNGQMEELQMLRDAFYSYDDEKTRVKYEPFILEGGWDEWLKFYPAFKRQTEFKNIPFQVETKLPVDSEKPTDAVTMNKVPRPLPRKTVSSNNSDKPLKDSTDSNQIDTKNEPRKTVLPEHSDKVLKDNISAKQTDIKNESKTNGYGLNGYQELNNNFRSMKIDTPIVQFQPQYKIPEITNKTLQTEIRPSVRIVPRVDRSSKPKPALSAETPKEAQNVKFIYSETGISNYPHENNKLNSNLNMPKIDRSMKPKPEVLHERKRLTFDELNPIWSPTRPGLTGIRNLGNTCYMNSIIQCLVNTVFLREYFQQSHYLKDLNRDNVLGSGGQIADEFSLIVKAIWSGECKVIMPKKFKAVCGKFAKMFDNNDQHDSQEFLMILLDALHEDLNRIRKRPSNLPELDTDNMSDEKASSLSWERHLLIHNSIIVEQFQGQTRSTVTCLTCKKKSIRFDAFMYLQLPFPNQRHGSAVSIYDCLDEYCRPERIEWFCPQCKRDQQAIQKIDLWSLPKLLVVHLKRFSYEGPWRNKINALVDFPLDNLVLNSYIVNRSKEQFIFNLYAVSNHVGTLNGGHYTALCKNSNRWFKFDDQDVYEIQKESQIKTNQAYILFYSRFNYN